jgi:uncharacterized protein (DUF305 family)
VLVQGNIVRAVVATALLVVVAGCSSAEEPERAASTAPVVQLGAPGERNRSLSPDEAAEITGPQYVEQDVTFIRHMLYHHEQAMTMTALVEERTEDERIRLLAERMAISQEAEMDQMEDWLAQRNETLVDPRDPDHAHAAATMPGLLSDEEMAALAAASDEEFDRLFLVSMIRHHEGAIEMVYELYSSGGGNESEVDSIARHVESDQSIEITRMQQLRAAMDG